jgi:DNA-binding transcriptional ArsR family regulator
MNIIAFQALADPTRFQIVEALLAGEMAVNDIVGQVGVHQSGVSRHLRILQKACFVQVRPDGQKRLYSLRPEPFEDLGLWVARYRRIWEGRLARFAAALGQRQSTRKRDPGESSGRR